MSCFLLLVVGLFISSLRSTVLNKILVNDKRKYPFLLSTRIARYKAVWNTCNIKHIIVQFSDSQKRAQKP